MYHYSNTDQELVDRRVLEFRDQTRRFLSGNLSEEQFRPLRLMNGLYIQRHAPMLRIAIPYGELGSRQLRKLATISESYDKGFGHITTRQNIQFNWLQLEQVPDILEELASVQMHAIQTSGNCIRNITCDHLAGIDCKRSRRPTTLVRAGAAMGGYTPGISISAAKIQNRIYWLKHRSGRNFIS